MWFQEALSLTEFELMELLDVGMARVTSAVAHISEIVSPPTRTVRIIATCKTHHSIFTETELEMWVTVVVFCRPCH